MGDGRARSDKVMLPEEMMDQPDELRGWIARAFAAAARLPPKEGKTKTVKAKTSKTKAVAEKRAPAKKSVRKTKPAR